MLTILFLASNPHESTRLRLDKEFREIEEKIRLSNNRDQLKLVSKWAVRTSDLFQAINEFEPDIIHFSGHGEKCEIILEGNDGKMTSASKSSILKMLKLCENLKVVIFNICSSFLFAKEISEHIDYAVGMNGKVYDDSAIAFAYRFYSGIGFGRNVEKAFMQAQTEIELLNLEGSDTPKLYIKQGIDKNKPLISKETLKGDEETKSSTIFNVYGNSGQINNASGGSVMNTIQNKGYDVKKNR